MAVSSDDWQVPLILHLQSDWAEATLALLDVLCFMFSHKFEAQEDARLAGMSFGNLLAAGASEPADA